ncbi:desiccation-related protein PCC13-62-like [Impatiens glandulifera]|uniref:desiccation-related protein PCC13-62-like n=1 Tax=Impatiens glandulifera TaxID=253017 RepID=UPI001FB127DD|nr:desiccation-related protein PCC13-62-like [Impatiens glandulifera]
MGGFVDSNVCINIIAVMSLIISSCIMGENISDPKCDSPLPSHAIPVYESDVDSIQFALNLEYLEAEFFCWGSMGVGLDVLAPYLVKGGPSPIGVQKANLDPLVSSIIMEFAFEELDHLRAIWSTVGGFPRPLLDLSPHNFANIFDMAFGYNLNPPFNPYRDSLSYMLASYVIPYMGLVGYVGANPLLIGYKSKRLLAGLLGVEAGQDAVIRTYLYELKEEVVKPYNISVAEFTTRISELRNKLAACGIRDEPIIVPPQYGAYNRSETNILSADYYSLSYARTPAQILRVVYGTGDENCPGGFFPHGANGTIARSYLIK